MTKEGHFGPAGSKTRRAALAVAKRTLDNPPSVTERLAAKRAAREES